MSATGRDIGSRAALPSAPAVVGAVGARAWLRWLASVAWAVVLLWAAQRVAPRVELSPVAAFGVGFMFVSVSALVVAARCPPVGRRALPLALLPAGGLLWLSASPLGDLEMALVVTACLLLAASLIGTVVGTAIEHPGHLLFVAIVSAAADVFSVFHPSGPSAAIVQSEAALSVLALPWPMLGTPSIEPFLGAGDVVFTALYLASARKHALGTARTLLALTLAYAVTMVFVIALEATVPALPFLGLAMVVAHRQARKPPERDRIRGYAMAALVVAAVAALLLF